MAVYEGDPERTAERVLSIADGAVANVSRLELGVHTGTHVDAPVHFFDGAPAQTTLPLEALIGPAHVVDATGVSGLLDAAALVRSAPAGAERVLFKTATRSCGNAASSCTTSCS